NILHGTMRRTNAFRICTEDRMTLLSSGTHQAVMNIFSALLNGAGLCPFNVKEEGATQLVNWLIREKITIYHSSTSLFRQLVSTLTGKEDLSKIRLVRSASETVTEGEVESYRKHFSPDCLFTNGLGTTETGTSVMYFIDKDSPIATETVPVGYPLQDMEILLLDDHGREVGFNRVGEIAVRSRYLSPGYWREPDLTRAKFLPDPEGANKRIYLTGDLGRMSEDGCLEHLGRKDFQVKVRGYRIETADVEAKLLAHPGIKQTAVLGQQKRSDDTQLVAYFVPATKPGPSVSELRRFLREKLPDYMVPAAFVMLDEIPLTPNGKIDRRALPPSGHVRPKLDVPFVAPRTPVEEVLARIWTEVLGLDQAGIHDNFLDLGGHSLMATQIILRVMEAFQIELPLQSLLEAPTVAKMALIIMENQAKKAGDEDLTRMLAELEALSEDEAQRLLSDKDASQP
ncbi:MAG: non-ribosomal peptide synthetase, partial [Candidatus Binatia bacterium]